MARMVLDADAEGEFAFKKREGAEQRKVMYLNDDPCQIQHWVHRLGDQHTFETHILPLTLPQAKALLFVSQYFSRFKTFQIENSQMHDTSKGLHLNYDEERFVEAQSGVDQSSYPFGERFDFTVLKPERTDALHELAEAIDQLMDEMKWEDGAFIRLSTRSPKDSALESMKMYRMLKKRLEVLKEENPETTLAHQQIVNAFYECSTKSLCIENGIEAVELLARSRRTYVDLNMAMLKQGEEDLEMGIVIRRWQPDIDPLWEFRMFLKKREPTGLTQYHDKTFVQEIYDNREQIEAMLLERYREVEPLLPENLEDFTLDFAIAGGLESTRIWIIEVNHFPPIAGPALFDWNNENDRKLINEGPFEFRVLDPSFTCPSLEESLPDSSLVFLQSLGYIEKENDGMCNVQ